MSVFQNTRNIPVKVDDLSGVVTDTVNYFKAKDFEVKSEKTITGSWLISMSKGGIFKNVLGMKTALNIEIEPVSFGTSVKAGAGIFGQQVIPSIITVFVAWPVIISQIWGLIQQSKLDDEAVSFVEMSLYKQNESRASMSGAAAGSAANFCTQCGCKLESKAKFCPQCGSKL